MAARHWASANQLLLDDLPHLDRVTTVQYEKLCADPHSALNRLAEFLSIPEFDSSDQLTELDIHSLDESIDGIVNFNSRSFDRLSRKDMDDIADEAEEVADTLGYEIPPRRA